MLAFLMIVALGIWVVHASGTGMTRSNESLLVGVQSYYGGDQPMTREEMEPYFERAVDRAKNKNEWGNRWKIVGQFASWFAFLAATVMTGVAAYFGRISPVAGQTLTQTVAFLQSRVGKNAWAVGILSAVIAVFTAVANKAEGDASRYYKRADEITQLVRNTRGSIFAEKPLKREQVKDLLDELDLESQR